MESDIPFCFKPDFEYKVFWIDKNVHETENITYRALMDEYNFTIDHVYQTME